MKKSILSMAAWLVHGKIQNIRWNQLSLYTPPKLETASFFTSKNGHLEVPTFLLGPGATSPRGANRESTSRLVIGCYEVQIGCFHK